MFLGENEWITKISYFCSKNNFIAAIVIETNKRNKENKNEISFGFPEYLNKESCKTLEFGENYYI